MPQTREIKRRIRSVKSTQQITRAMKMVAAAKLRRAQDRMVAMRPYAEKLGDLLRYLATDLVGDEHPFFRPREEKRVLTIVIAGDRGLCGGFNSNILRAAHAHLNGLPQVEHRLLVVGKKAISALRKTKHQVLKGYHDVFEKLSYVLAGEICDLCVEKFSAKPEERIDAAYVVYNQFVNSMQQKPTVTKLLPIDYKSLAGERKQELSAAGAERRPIYEVEPSVEAALARLISRRLATQVYQATLESYSAELAARMTAMDNATTNAEEMIDSLTLIYNRARQTAITAELMDIVGGANALA